jgi:hypothetical protein
MYNAMTDHAIRKAIRHLRAARDAADATEQDVYEAQEMIYGMVDELIRRNTDPFTTAADIRYFAETDVRAYTG